MKLNKTRRGFLQKLADGWTPGIKTLTLEEGAIYREYEKRNLVRATWGKGEDERVLCANITALGRDTLMRTK